jgi:hypothetical protein
MRAHRVAAGGVPARALKAALASSSSMRATAPTLSVRAFAERRKCWAN